jgi:hypothetical protein
LGIKSTNKKAQAPVRHLQPWWNAPKTGDGGSRLSRRLWDTIATLEETQLSTIQALLKAFRIYQGREDLNTFTWFGAGTQGFQSGAGLGTYDVPKWNLIKACSQTLQSRIAADPVKVMALTDGGNYSDKRKAEDMTKFGAGAMESSGANAMGPECFVDGTWAGDGYVYVYPDNSEDGNWRVCAEKVFPAEIIVDEAECLVTNGNPRQFYRKRVMSRPMLLALYPSKKDVINQSQVEIVNLGMKAAVDEMIVVFEAFHLRSNYKAKDGRHVLAVSGGTLVDEPYEKPGFPFAHYRWTKLPLGFYGESLVAMVASVQASITKTLYIIDQSLEILGLGGVLIEDGSDVIIDHLSGGIGAAIRYTGIKPEPWTALDGNSLQWHFKTLEMQKAELYDLCRISELSATGEVPNSLKSGEAIRTHQAVESIGFKQTQKDYQAFYIDMMKLHVEAARDIAKDKDKGFSVKTRDGKFMRSIKLQDVDLKNSEFTWVLWPTSFLGDSPEGKYDKVQDMVQGGFVTPEQGLMLLDFPDTKSVTQYNEAAIKWTEWAIGKILDDGIMVAPLPFATYKKIIDTSQAAYLTAQMESVPAPKLALLQNFWQQAIDKQNELDAQTAAAQQGAGSLAPQPGAVPQGRPMRAPMTPNLPQVAGNA